MVVGIPIEGRRHAQIHPDPLQEQPHPEFPASHDLSGILGRPQLLSDRGQGLGRAIPKLDADLVQRLGHGESSFLLAAGQRRFQPEVEEDDGYRLPATVRVGDPDVVRNVDVDGLTPPLALPIPLEVHHQALPVGSYQARSGVDYLPALQELPSRSPGAAPAPSRAVPCRTRARGDLGRFETLGRRPPSHQERKENSLDIPKRSRVSRCAPNCLYTFSFLSH